MIRILFVAVALTTTIVAAQEPEPAVPAEPELTMVTSSDPGPDIDPAELLDRPFNGLRYFPTFRHLVSMSYAIADVWIYAEGDDQELYDTKVGYPYADYYQPTWREVFDHVAQQMGCAWEWNPENRQFKFFRSTEEPFYRVTLAEGWRREDRGVYVWHAPEGLPFGLDIYFMGHYTASDEQPDLYATVRKDCMARSFTTFPNPPSMDDVKSVTLTGQPALHLTTDALRPGSRWRQWCVVVEGNSLLIVNAMPNERVAEMTAAVDRMLETLKVDTPADPPEAGEER